ncbi:hypothetical protein ACKWTF_014266 [Chironomus riparius]
MLKIIVIYCFLIISLDGALSTIIECNFNTFYNYNTVGPIYKCEVENNPNILTQESAQISEINGTHTISKNNDYVFGFKANFKTIQVFPIGLEKFFKNLKLIIIFSCQLKEIHQSDLKVFPDLITFSLASNKIEVIEEGLFDFNPNLEFVAFYETEIIHIDPNVFDHLTKLSHIRSFASCFYQDIFGSEGKVQSNIKVVKSNCTNSEFLNISKKVKNLEIESKTITLEALSIKLDKLEKGFNFSKFLKFRPISLVYQNLKQTVRCHLSNVQLISNVSKVVKLIQNTLAESQTKTYSILSRIDSHLAKHDTKFDQIQNSHSQLQDNMFSTYRNMITKISQPTNLQNEIKSSISRVEFKVNELSSSHKDAVISQTQKLNELKISQNDVKNVQVNLKTTLESVKTSLIESQETSFSNLTSNFNELKKNIKSIQDETRLSISNIEVKLSDHVVFQNYIKESINKNAEVGDTLAGFGEKLRNFDGKFEELEGKFETFESIQEKTSKKLDQIEQELTSKFQDMSTDFNEKVKGIEKRMMKKFEDLLEQKLEKFFTQKFGF